MFTPLKNLIPGALQHYGVKKEARAAHVCQKYRLLAPQHIHPEVLSHTFPRYYRRHILTVGVANPAWAHVVITRKKSLLEAINASLGNNAVSDIRTSVVAEVITSH